VTSPAFALINKYCPPYNFGSEGFVFEDESYSQIKSLGAKVSSKMGGWGRGHSSEVTVIIIIIKLTSFAVLEELNAAAE